MEPRLRRAKHLLPPHWSREIVECDTAKVRGNFDKRLARLATPQRLNPLVRCKLQFRASRAPTRF